MPGGKQVKRLARFFKVGLYLAIAEAIRLFVPKGNNSACLVLKIDALGDLFVWFSSGISGVSAYCREMPGHSVILVRQELAEFVHGLGLFDDVWPLDEPAFRTNILYRTKMLYRLRRHGYSKVLQLRIAREFLSEDAIVRAVGADEAWSPVGDMHNRSAWEARLGDRWYTPIARVQTNGVHELDRNFAVTTALTGKRPAPFVYSTESWQPPAGRAERYYIVAPGAGWAPRKWPTANFVEIARRARAASAPQCVIVGTRQDAAAGEEIAKAAGGLNLCGRLGLADLAAVIRKSAFAVSNEAGISHMAAYFRVPSVAVLGGGHFGWFMPYPENWPGLEAPRAVVHRMECFGCNWQCRYRVARGQPVPCIERIGIDTVWSKVEAILRLATN